MSPKKNNQNLECSSGRSQKRSLNVKGCNRPLHWENEKYKKKKHKYLSKWSRKKQIRKEKIMRNEFFGKKKEKITNFKGYKKELVEEKWVPWYLEKNQDPSCWYNSHTKQRVLVEPINKVIKIYKWVSVYE